MDLDAFVLGYIECALWSTTDNSREDGGDPLDDNYSLEDISDATLAKMKEDCEDFQRANEKDLEDWPTPGQAGHDFWLTREGHGTGFWDRGWGTNESRERLTEAARVYRGFDLYVGDDGKIYSL